MSGIGRNQTKVKLILSPLLIRGLSGFAFLFLLSQAGFSNSNDSIYIEAESGMVEYPMLIKDDNAASGLKYVEVEEGFNSTGSPPDSGKISFEVALDSGTYNIWGRVITPSGSDDSFWVGVDGGPAYKWNKIGTNPEWKWLPVHDDDNGGEVVSWNLAADTHTITIFYREDGARIDEIYITKYGDTPTKGNVDLEKEQTIYISHESGVDQDNDGSFHLKPIKTLARAYEIAQSAKHEFGAFRLLLRGGETYRDFTPREIDLYDNGKLSTFAFIWDIDRKLTISTYFSAEKALFYGGKQKSEGGPTQAILVVSPSKQDVLIENLSFKMWQEGTIMVFESEDVTIRNIRIDSIGTYYIPDDGINIVDENYPFAGGVVYPKNSTRILIEHVEMTNCHNHYERVDDLHGFYCTRLNHSEIRYCYMKNVSGSPFKFRRSQANNCYIHHNECYYTGHTTHNPNDLTQPGFLRYSGDPGGNCPYALVFESNIFHYPYCWPDKEDCSTATAVLCSVSNKESCGADACWNDTTRVKWINNDIIYQWEPDTTVSSVAVDISAPVNYEIKGIVPNPSSGFSTLKVFVHYPSRVRVTLMNLHGQVMSIPVDGEIISGEQSIRLDLNESPAGQIPGVYLCRIQIGNATEFRRVICLQ